MNKLLCGIILFIIFVNNFVSMKPHLRTTKMIRDTLINEDTGEVLDENITRHTVLVDKDSFFLMYSKILGVFENLSVPEIKIFSFILENYTSGATFQLGRPIKKLMCKRYSLKEGTISNAISGLKSKGVLFSTERGLYEIHPQYAWKGYGGTSQRDKRLKYILELETND